MHQENSYNFFLKFDLMCSSFILQQRTSELMLLCLQVDSQSIVAGKAAMGNLLGGIGYFFGQSKIALPRDMNVSHTGHFYGLLVSFNYFVLSSIFNKRYNLK